jgi:hypothetical protein
MYRACKLRNPYKILIGKSEGKRVLGRRRRIWKDTIKMDLEEICHENVDGTHLAQDRVE